MFHPAADIDIDPTFGQARFEQFGEVAILLNLLVPLVHVGVGIVVATRQLAGRYDYPNPNMYQRDEKVQQNRYLAELLESCLAEGRVNVDVSSWVEHDG